MKGLVKDLISMVITKGAIVAFGVANSVVVARWLGPEKVGMLAALMVYPSLFLSFGSLGLRQATTYFVGQGLYSEDEIKRAIVQIWCLSTALSLAACYLLVRHFSSGGDQLLLAVLAVAPIPFVLFNQYNQGLFLGRNDIQAFNKINWVPTALTFAATAVLVIGLEEGLPGAMMAAFVGPAFMAALLTVRHNFLHAISPRTNGALIRKLLALGVVYAFSLLVINLNYRVDVILMDHLSTDYELGIYSRGATLVEYIWQIPMLLSTIIFARSATTDDHDQFSRKVLQLLRVSIIVIGIASLSLMVLADQVITLLYGTAFLPSGLVLVILLPGVLVLTFYKVLNMDLAGMGKPWIAVKAMGPALVVNVVFNLFWIPSYGANGAAAASTLSYGLAALLFLFAYARETGIPVREIVRFRADDFALLRKPPRASTDPVMK